MTTKNQIECVKIGANIFGDPIYQTVASTHAPRKGLTRRDAEGKYYGDAEIEAAVESSGRETCIGDEARKALGWEIAILAAAGHAAA
jgi:hypothetical protein